jgi:hypothetical protein
MRTLLIVAALARVASADPDRKCYEGTTTFGSIEPRKLVVVREADRAKRVIRETIWHDEDPAAGRSKELAIDPDKGTFTFDLPKGRGHGTGTLEGKPWQWTAFHSKVDVPALKMQVVTDGTLAGDVLDVTTVMGADAKTTEHTVVKAFDCNELEKRRLALEPSSPAAVHACYVGTDTGDGRTLDVIIDHVVDRTAHAFRIVRYLGPNHRRDVVFHIDGERVTVTAPGSPAATGTLTGKPWAWTSYSWKRTDPKLATENNGTVGGDHITEKSKIGKLEFVLDATRFDCGKLAERRAALKDPPPLR